MQRTVEYRHSFATTANKFLTKVLTKTKVGNDADPEALMFPTPESRKDMVGRYRKGLRFLYSDPDFDNPKSSTGIFRSAYYLVVLAHHFKCAQGALPPPGKSVEDPPDPPIGAMVLAAIAIERAFKAWKTGEFVEGSVDDFSFNSYQEATRVYLKHIDDLDDDTINDILQQAFSVYLGEDGPADNEQAGSNVSDSDDDRRHLSLQ
ncbi:hypothetical protein BD626DRAFT_521816 [Schizophyllum amplum]|uniref:DUF6532 domain-containing protein n=1 Tax=Schizophyllum amplum TaxID=97359 RepID=A0A550BTI1_9AGAR|nr:hypothetical protein BD626DRAFT_521816 [Auriculariopsis ampla]